MSGEESSCTARMQLSPYAIRKDNLEVFLAVLTQYFYIH